MRLLEGPKLPERLNFIPGLKNSNLSGNGQFCGHVSSHCPGGDPIAMDRITALQATSMAVTEEAKLDAPGIESSTPDGHRPPTLLTAAPPNQRLRLALDDVESLEKRRTIDDVRAGRAMVDNESLPVRMPGGTRHFRFAMANHLVSPSRIFNV